MDETWPVRIGSKLPRQRSTEQTTSDFMRKSCYDLRNSEPETLDPEDFNDVFGGPPRSVFLRQNSGNSSASFYDEIFRPAEFEVPARNGRNLPEFSIPARGRQNEGFYDDIFGSGKDRRSRSRSKSNSSSVLSSEDLSPLCSEDFSSFASKLRPILIPSRQSSKSTFSREQSRRVNSTPSTRPSFMEFQFTEAHSSEQFTTSQVGFSQCIPSPETINLEPSSYQSLKTSVNNLDIDSPSSEISSLELDIDARAGIREKASQEKELEEAELLSSYVIEIRFDRKEDKEEAVAVDEAIAWAKEKSRTRNLKDLEAGNQQKNARETWKERETWTDEGMQVASTYPTQPRGCRKMQFHSAEASKAKKETQQSDKHITMKKLEVEVKLWSAGKEGNIRALLSTLQYILWPDSGWHAIPLIDMIESSHLKKAYQKARLCLHPDKLQQKGATISQKYIAKLIFILLQDAWATLNSPDVFSG
ncbi:uncharacterized protein LOC143854870 [Tasmannia lanceolata]|uniref:uncharacterized protein LOC143854870 n=1 Tax=Tasmannia lanceolata TaxID=3420 RepID=UPI0040629DF1